MNVDAAVGLAAMVDTLVGAVLTELVAGAVVPVAELVAAAPEQSLSEDIVPSPKGIVGCNDRIILVDDDERERMRGHHRAQRELGNRRVQSFPLFRCRSLAG
jgi:hypothetical protein